MRDSLGSALTLALVLMNSTSQAQPPVGERMREAFERLDTNGDTVLERSEIPEEGIPAFERLLKRGDANKDGKLDAEELRGLGEKVRAAAGPQAGRPGLAAMDRDSDGKVTREEFRGPRALFDRLDGDKNGVLSGEELKPRGPAARPDRGSTKAPRLKAMDKDGDDRISREEFTGPAVLFDRLDVNKDGVIDRADGGGGAGRPKQATRAGNGGNPEK